MYQVPYYATGELAQFDSAAIDRLGATAWLDGLAKHVALDDGPTRRNRPRMLRWAKLELELDTPTGKLRVYRLAGNLAITVTVYLTAPPTETAATRGSRP